MSRVYHAFPTAAPLPQSLACIEAWKAMGYGTAIIVLDEPERRKLPADIVQIHEGNKYPGFAVSTNRIAYLTLKTDPECQIIIAGGDDVYPDQNKRADEIADEFIEHFGGTLGVMQPHGDEWHHTHDRRGYIADNAAWSPWLGREWCQRAYMGRGPLNPDFYHYYNDTNLFQVAQWLGLLWVRPDVVHGDRNWKRERKHLGRPVYLREAKRRNAADAALCAQLQTEGFPGCGLLP
jgi:hypothetical protein